MASGDRRITARKPKDGEKPAGKKAKKLSQKEQSERFIETARALGADETGRDFDAIADRLLPPKEPIRDGD